MKAPYVIGLIGAAVLITVAVEESRIATLRRQLPKGAANPVVRSRSLPEPAMSATEESGPALTKRRNDNSAPVSMEAGSQVKQDNFAGTMRKMFENPAGKSLMSEQAKMVVAIQYQEFIDGMDLTPEERDYFKQLLGSEISDQQELGMKMLGATPDEQKELAEQLTVRGKESQQAIRDFLNDEKDFAAFTEYKNRLPERQQLSGIRSALSRDGVPIDADTEARLVDAMYLARTQTKTPDLSGPAGIQAINDGKLTETFEKSWDQQQEALRSEVSQFFNEKQLATFADYQTQMKEMQMMSLKMAEKMMSGKKDEE